MSRTIIILRKSVLLLDSTINQFVCPCHCFLYFINIWLVQLTIWLLLRRLAHGQMSESESLGHFVQFPVKIAIQQINRSLVCLLCATGRGIPSVLGFWERMCDHWQALVPDASRREFGGSSTNILCANYSKPNVVNPAVSAVGGREYIRVR